MVRPPIRPGQVDLEGQKCEGDRATRWFEEAVKGEAVDDDWRANAHAYFRIAAVQLRTTVTGSAPLDCSDLALTRNRRPSLVTA